MPSMRVQAKVKNGVTEVKALINHPMETGSRKDNKTGEAIPEHYITELTCEYNGKVVLKTDLSSGISKDPYLAFQFKGGNAGDSVKLTWKDNQGGTDTQVVNIK